MNTKLLSVVVLSLCCGLTGHGQDISTKLGYAPGTKLLILHADDLGVAHSVNDASFDALASGAVSSASIMVPCPWLLEVSVLAASHPESDLGLHLTLTAEWNNYKWNGVLCPEKNSSLLNDQGYFYDNTADVIKNANPEELRKELQAQVDRAVELGLKPSHLDSHMGALFQNPEVFRIYVETGLRNRIPVFVPKQAAALFTTAFPQPEEVVPVNLPTMEYPQMESTQWINAYLRVLDELEPGLNELIVHLGHDDEELQAVTIDHPDYGAKWRSLDLEVVTSQEFRSALKERNIQLVTWRQIAHVLFP